MTKSSCRPAGYTFPQLVPQDADFAVKTMLDAMSESHGESSYRIRGFGSFGLNLRHLSRTIESQAKVPEVRKPEQNCVTELDRIAVSWMTAMLYSVALVAYSSRQTRESAFGRFFVRTLGLLL